jgi:DNA-binding GntR family transcriptional regulator
MFSQNPGCVHWTPVPMQHVTFHTMGASKAAKRSEVLGLADIVQRLEEEIALGLLRPRERLVEDELLSRFGVKRHIVRQVLAELELMGIVTRRPNRGATVRDFTADEIEQIYFVRELLERAAIEVMPLPAGVAVVTTLDDLHTRHCVAVKAGRLRDVFRLNLEFHQTLFEACGNAPLTEAISQFAFKAHAIRSYTIGDPNLLARVCKEHAQMIKLMRGSDRPALVKLVSEHKQPAKLAYIQASRRMERGIEAGAPEALRRSPAPRPQGKRGSGSGLSPARARKSRSQPSSA